MKSIVISETKDSTNFDSREPYDFIQVTDLTDRTIEKPLTLSFRHLSVITEIFFNYITKAAIYLSHTIAPSLVIKNSEFNRVEAASFNLNECQVDYITVENVNFFSSVISACTTEKAVLSIATFYCCNLSDLSKTNYRLEKVEFSNSSISYCQSLIVQGIKLSFDWSNISNTNLLNSKLEEAQFNNTKLQYSNLKFCSFNNNSFFNSWINQVVLKIIDSVAVDNNFNNCKIEESKLQGSFKNLTLDNCILTYFIGSGIFENINVSGTSYDCQFLDSKIQGGLFTRALGGIFSISLIRCKLDSVNFMQVLPTISSSTIQNSQFSHCDFSNVSIVNVTFKNCSFIGCSFIKGQFFNKSSLIDCKFYKCKNAPFEG